MSDKPETDCEAPNCCKGDQWPQCQGGREVPDIAPTHYTDDMPLRDSVSFTD